MIMTLIRCPECRREVSTEAAACPHCGYALGGSKDVQVIEQTAKTYKGIMVAGVLGFLLGVMGCSYFPEGIWKELSTVVSAVGFVTALAARALAWWHHG